MIAAVPPVWTSTPPMCASTPSTRPPLVSSAAGAKTGRVCTISPCCHRPSSPSPRSIPARPSRQRQDTFVPSPFISAAMADRKRPRPAEPAPDPRKKFLQHLPATAAAPGEPRRAGRDDPSSVTYLAFSHSAGPPPLPRFDIVGKTLPLTRSNPRPAPPHLTQTPLRRQVPPPPPPMRRWQPRPPRRHKTTRCRCRAMYVFCCCRAAAPSPNGCCLQLGCQITSRTRRTTNPRPHPRTLRTPLCCQRPWPEPNGGHVVQNCTPS